MNSVTTRIGLLLILVTGLAACSGGGGGSGSSGNTGGNTTPTPVVSDLSFNLQSAFITLVAYGPTGNFTISGSCTGTGSRSEAPAATSDTFEGAQVLSSVGILEMSFSDCKPNTSVDTYTNYYDANYSQLGYSDGVYGVYAAAPSLPDAVKVGDEGTLGTMNLFTDSGKGTQAGSRQVRYVIEADTADTAIVNLVTEERDAGGVLTKTEQDRYRIAETGPLVPVSTDIQNDASAISHLLLSYN